VQLRVARKGLVAVIMVNGNAQQLRAEAGKRVRVPLVQHELLARHGFPIQRIEDQHKRMAATQSAQSEPAAALRRLR
jgi:hypothetical protein